MTYQEVKEAVLQLTPAERQALREELEEIARSEDEQFIIDDDPITLEEAQELVKSHPMSPKDVIAAGLTGTMPDLPDGVEWVNARKRERAERRRWSLD
jgi:hypothetical protein